MSSVTIRPGAAGDLEAINRIYNHYVVSSPATFDIEPITRAQRTEWLGHYGETGRHRLLVAERAGGVLGYATSSRLRERAAYDTSVEVTVYLAPEETGRGIGRSLYAALFEAIADEDIHRAYAGVTLPNPASEALHRACGFEPIGRYHEVGRKFDRYWSVQWFEKRLVPGGRK